MSSATTAQEGGDVAAELAQGQLAAVGIDSTIEIVPAGSTTWQDEVYVAKSPQLALDGTIGRESPVANLLARSEEHKSELQSLMRISYAVFVLKNKNNKKQHKYHRPTITYHTSHTCL